MATEKLFYEDAYLRVFTAKVLKCTERKDGYEIVLDRSAFYPEGGGQGGDTGCLGGVNVTDTHERDGEIVHYCDAPLAVGETVTGEIDWRRRFDLMQQHSGEHIVSGLICTRFGCDNVGFHLGSEQVVIDFNAAISAEDLAEIEREANAVIWENRPFLVTYPTPEELETLPYRSKKELSGRVRIVECPGADMCACCGTHVAAAGELGVIKLLSVKPFREGVRIEMVAGMRAYEHLCRVSEQNSRISVRLSAKVGETADAVERVCEELADAKYRLTGLENKHFQRLAQRYAGKGDVLIFEEDLKSDAVRRCCDAVAGVCGGRCAVFSGADGAGYKYAVGAQNGDVRALVKDMNAALHGRGGGKPDFAQGSVNAARAEIEEYFAFHCKS